MARKAFWKSDWFLGVAAAVAVLVISRTDFVQSMERKAYDLGVRASNRMASDRIAVIAKASRIWRSTSSRSAHSTTS
jgi:eukaryotic-like serine/threonine-protein kinase